MVIVSSDAEELLYIFKFTGVEMMKLFVLANSLVIFLTVAWPSMKEALYIMRDYFLK